MADRLAGKVAVITGGASGIGLETARRFISEGARIGIGDLSEERLASARAELGDAAIYEALDVRVESSIEQLVASTVAAFGSVDIGVNCAGLGTFATVTTMSEEQWDLVNDVCLKGVFLSIKHEGKQMLAQGRGGAIINIASINARQPAEGMSAYCAAKAGVEMLTRCAAMELGPSGIRVTGIGPGLIDTPLTRYQQDNPPLREAYLRMIPMGRVGATADIASAALFLASDDASWVNGDTLFVDGGELTKMYPEMLRLRGQR